MGLPDPEEWYQWEPLMAYCGQKDAALRLLKSAVQQIIARTRRSWTIRY